MAGILPSVQAASWPWWIRRKSPGHYGNLSDCAYHAQKIKASKDLLKKIIPKYNISLISLGNGTASRESEQFIVELLKEIPEKVQYVIVNEAGASVYSASKLASE